MLYMLLNPNYSAAYANLHSYTVVLQLLWCCVLFAGCAAVCAAAAGSGLHDAGR
jgi:hypothetical protein